MKGLILLISLVFITYNTMAQYDTVHYVAPSRWKYVNDRHEIVFSTLSTTTVQIEISRSDGTLLGTETVIKGSPTRFSLPGTPVTNQRNTVNTVFSDEGLIITATEMVSVNIRNINGDTNDAIIKGNTSLTSKGYLALGEQFHLIYYRDFGAFYGIMATEDNTSITMNGIPLITLNAGESYVIGGNSVLVPLGALIESDKPISMTSSFDSESPGQCADPTADQLIPNSIAGEEYIVVRGQGNTNLLIEFTTIMATEANTNVIVNGALNTTLVLPGDFVTISNGTMSLDVNLIETNRPVLLAQGAGQGCEHGMSIIPPLKCTGSSHIETKNFNNLDYSVFLLSKCTAVQPTLNGITLTGGVAIPNTNWTLFQFDNTDVTGENIILDSQTPMHVGILQDGGNFGGFAYFSGFSRTGINVTATTPSGDSTIIEGCVPAQYVFTRESFCDKADTILVNVAGTATEGVDFNTLPDTLFFTPGVDTLLLNIESFADNIIEGEEKIQIFVVADRNCDGILDTVTSTLIIHDYLPMQLTLDKKEIDLCVDYYCSSTSESETVSATVINGIPPYFASWSDGFNESILTTSPSSTNTFSEANGNVPIVDSTYFVTVFDACNNEVTASVFIENNCTICAPNVITPNGDNINEYFIIKNIIQYPEATVTILNRWGNILYETENYQNNWSGTELSDGVYFYSVILNGEINIHGFFHLIR